MESARNPPGPPGPMLARVFDWGKGQTRIWEPAEYRAVVEHLLGSPVEFEVAGLEPSRAGRLALLSEAQGLLVKSFGDLLRHPAPPCELLELTKEWAKANQADAGSSLPPEIAGFLYYACIAAALVRLGRRITSLDDGQLHAGLTWAGAQPWVAQDFKSLFSEADAKLGPAAAK